MMPDPRVDALTGEGKRLSLPIIVEIYPSREAAASAAAELGDVRETGVPAAASSAEPDNGYPPVPGEWGEENREDWIAFLAEEKKNIGTLPTIPPKREELAERCVATFKEIEAWWPLV
jgi:hypothetical protein